MKLLILAALAAVLLVLVFLASEQIGPGGPDHGGREVALTVERGNPEIPTRAAGRSPAVNPTPGGRGNGRVQARPSGVLARPTSGAWTLSMLVRFEDGRDASEWSDVLYGAVTIDRGERREFGVSLRPDGHAVALHCDLDDVDFGLATFSLATSSYAMQAADGRVLFGDTVERRGGKRLADADAVDRAGRNVDLGLIELHAPDHLGHLSFDPPVQREMSAFVGIGTPPEAFETVFRNRRLGQVVAIPAGTTSIRCSTFATPRSWFATLTSASGATAFRGDAEVGKDITITESAHAGIDLTVDLARHPNAGRVLLMRSNVPLRASLDDTAFFERVTASQWSAAIPMPKSRVGKTSYPIGLVEVRDGFYRVEVWSLKGPSGDRSMLASQAIQVAGDLVTVIV